MHFYETRTRNLFFTAMAFSGIALEIACESDQWFCQDNEAYVLQGVIVFFLGMDVVLNSVVECVMFRPLSSLEPENIHAAAFTTFGLPFVWFLLAGSTLAEQTFFCV